MNRSLIRYAVWWGCLSGVLAAVFGIPIWIAASIIAVVTWIYLTTE